MLTETMLEMHSFRAAWGGGQGNNPTVEKEILPYVVNQRFLIWQSEQAV